MCRLYGFRSNEPTKVDCTLVHAQNGLLAQSYADLRGTAHEDGWGIAFYHDTIPELEKRDYAAHHDLHFSTTAERIYARTVIAHVRQATVGGPSLQNTHPFTYGHWSFAHNGTVTGFDRLQKRLQSEVDPALLFHRSGSTDSELLFYWLLTRMRCAGFDLDEHVPDVPRWADVLATSLRLLDVRCREVPGAPPAKLNVLLTDGSAMVATKWRRTLHWLSLRGIHDCEICGIPHVHHDPEADYRAVIVASEPISHDRWQEVADGSVLSVDRNIDLKIRPIAPN